jgi:hypothetical protein
MITTRIYLIHHTNMDQVANLKTEITVSTDIQALSGTRLTEEYLSSNIADFTIPLTSLSM